MKNTDVLVIGGGAAGLTAAIYSARAGLSTIVIENGVPGGQIALAAEIANYPGFESISGAELSERLAAQARANGAVIEEFDPICSVDLKKKIVTTRSCVYRCDTIIIASGRRPRKLRISGAEKLEGKSIHYCASCDGAFYKNKRVAVIGGGNSAAEGALFLSELAEEVVVLVRGELMKAENSRINMMKSRRNITVLYNTEPESINSAGAVVTIAAKDGRKLDCNGIFVFIGAEPSTELVYGQLEIDSDGCILTDESMQTSVEGVFAAGDIRSKAVRQLTTAVSDGTIAAIAVQKYLMKKERK